MAVFCFLSQKNKETRYISKGGVDVKKLLSIVLIIVVILSTFSFCFVSTAIGESDAESQIVPRFSTISSYSVTFNISGLTASINIRLNSSYTTNLKIIAKLQKETSSGYEVVETWTASKTSAVTVSLSETKIINPLNNYRLRIEFVADEENIVIFRDPT